VQALLVAHQLALPLVLQLVPLPVHQQQVQVQALGLVQELVVGGLEL